MRRWRARIEADEQIAIPTEALREAGLETGDTVVVHVVDGEIRIMSLQRAISRAQAIVRRYVPDDRSLVDELIAERRGDV